MGSQATSKSAWYRRMKKKGEDRILNERQRLKTVNERL